MCIVIAHMNPKLNSFLPVPATLSVFNSCWDKEALIAGRGLATVMGAFTALAVRIGASTSTPVFAHANSYGSVDIAA